MKLLPILFAQWTHASLDKINGKLKTVRRSAGSLKAKPWSLKASQKTSFSRKMKRSHNRATCSDKTQTLIGTFLRILSHHNFQLKLLAR